MNPLRVLHFAQNILRQMFQMFAAGTGNLPLQAPWARPPEQRSKEASQPFTQPSPQEKVCRAKALGNVLLRMALSPGSVPPQALSSGSLLPSHPQVFYWTHLSYLPMWLLLILHGPNFWKWLLIPGTLFFLEKAIGLVVSRMTALCIVEVNLLPSKVQRECRWW